MKVIITLLFLSLGALSYGNNILHSIDHYNKDDKPDIKKPRRNPKCDLSYASLHDVSLHDANFTGRDLSYCNFSWENFSYMDMRGVNLTGAIFIGADLSYTDFTDANLQLANLSFANLRGVNFTGADLRFVFLTTEHLHEANFTGAKVTEQSGKLLTSQGISGFVILK